MTAIRRILVAVKDPAARSMPAVTKAAQLSKALGADLELYHAIAHTVFVDAVASQAISTRQYERAQRQETIAALEQIAARVRRHRIKVSTSCEWDYPIYDAIVRRALRAKADMIVVERHAGAHRAKWLLTYTDWEVLRTAPCPVLIVKSPKPYHRPAVLAPIDPLHAYAKPTRLDAEILRTADLVRRGLRGRLHALYAYSPPAVLTGGFTAGAMPIPIEVSLGSADEARAELRAEIERLGIASVTEHVERASPVSAIPAVARSTGAAITVMGAISRSGLKRMFIGNTAELVLDQLQCDVLVVKPQNFKVRTPRAVAGMRLMASPLAPR